MGSRSRTFIILNLEDDFAEVGNETVNIGAEEADVDDKSKGAAKTFAVFERRIGTRVHHEFLGESGLSELFTLAGAGKAFGQVVAQNAFAGFLHGECTSLSLMYA